MISLINETREYVTFCLLHPSIESWRAPWKRTQASEVFIKRPSGFHYQPVEKPWHFWDWWSKPSFFDGASHPRFEEKNTRSTPKHGGRRVQIWCEKCWICRVISRLSRHRGAQQENDIKKIQLKTPKYGWENNSGLLLKRFENFLYGCLHSGVAAHLGSTVATHSPCSLQETAVK